MTSLLAIASSPRYELSTSRKLTSLFVEKWRAAHPGGEVVERDLIQTTLPFVDLPWIGGAFTPPEQHSPESAAAIKISNDLVAELQVSTAAEKCARWRRNSVPVGLIKQGPEALVVRYAV